MMIITPPVKKFMVLFLLLFGIVVYQPPVFAVIVNYDSNTESGSGSGNTSDGTDGTCPTNPPVTATASISADGSNYSTSEATISKESKIYLKASYTLNYTLAEINGYTWTCENCNFYTVGGIKFIGYDNGQSETIKEKSGSFSNGQVLTYMAGTVTQGDEYIKLTLSIDTTCVTENGTASDTVKLFIEEASSGDGSDNTIDSTNVVTDAIGEAGSNGKDDGSTESDDGDASDTGSNDETNNQETDTSGSTTSGNNNGGADESDGDASDTGSNDGTDDQGNSSDQNSDEDGVNTDESGSAASELDGGAGGCGCDMTGNQNLQGKSLPLLLLALISMTMIGRVSLVLFLKRKGIS